MFFFPSSLLFFLLSICPDDRRSFAASSSQPKGSSTLACDMLVAVDSTLLEKYNNNLDAVKKLVHRLVSGLNDIYHRTIFVHNHANLYFRLVNIEILYDFCNHCNQTQMEFLQQFSKFKYSEYCLAFLLTYRDFPEGLAGLAWRGTICSDTFNTGFLTFLNNGIHSSEQNAVITLAHEVGHLLGATHDENTECSGHVEEDFLMSEVGTSHIRPVFSQCSLSAMREVLDEQIHTSCFKENTKDVEVGLCGNGIVEGMEQCDCGMEYRSCDDPCCHAGHVSPSDRYWNASARPCQLNTKKTCTEPVWSLLFWVCGLPFIFITVLCLLACVTLVYDWRTKKLFYKHINQTNKHNEQTKNHNKQTNNRSRQTNNEATNKSVVSTMVVERVQQNQTQTQNASWKFWRSKSQNGVDEQNGVDQRFHTKQVLQIRRSEHRPFVKTDSVFSRIELESKKDASRSSEPSKNSSSQAGSRENRTKSAPSKSYKKFTKDDRLWNYLKGSQAEGDEVTTSFMPTQSYRQPIIKSRSVITRVELEPNNGLRHSEPTRLSNQKVDKRSYNPVPCRAPPPVPKDAKDGLRPAFHFSLTSKEPRANSFSPSPLPLKAIDAKRTVSPFSNPPRHGPTSQNQAAKPYQPIEPSQTKPTSPAWGSGRSKSVPVKKKWPPDQKSETKQESRGSVALRVETLNKHQSVPTRYSGMKRNYDPTPQRSAPSPPSSSSARSPPSSSSARSPPSSSSARSPPSSSSARSPPSSSSSALSPPSSSSARSPPFSSSGPASISSRR